MQRVLCPRHEERTPSCVVYEDHAFCYGGCGLIPLSELGRAGVPPVSSARPPSDIKSELARIRSLPTARVRGVVLPVDADSYYLLWPGDTYYKRRKFLPGDGPKYVCPRGHKKPLYVPHEPKGADTLFVVEGELNALSLVEIGVDVAVCSPGGVGDFRESLLKDEWEFFGRYDKFHLVLDKDKPGLDAAKRFKQLLLSRGKWNVAIHLMERDCNELLQAGTLREEVERWK